MAGRIGVARRIARPFIFLVLIIGLVAWSELSAAIATEFMSAQEAELSRLLNNERVGNGLPPLSSSEALRTVARRHSQRMLIEGRIFHNQRLKEDVAALFPAWQRIGENVGVGPDVPAVHRAFMQSPAHRANVLDPDFAHLGVGVVSGGNRLFMTENFLLLQAGARRPPPATFRLAGSSRTATAGALAEFGFAPGSAAGAVLAPAFDFHGALAGAAIAGQIRGPILLSQTEALDGEASQALVRALGANSGKTVYVVGGPFEPHALDQVRALGLRVVPIGNADHAATSAAVAQSLARRPTRAFVTTVENYPDALAVAALAARTGWPVLYTDPARLSPAVADVLRLLGIRETVIVGGTAAVSEAVARDLRAIGAPAARRLAGATRVETALAVADYGLANGLDPTYVQVATAENYPDALAGGALGAVVRSPVLLTPGDRLDRDVAAWLGRHRNAIDGIYLLGGSSALSTRVEADIASALR